MCVCVCVCVVTSVVTSTLKQEERDLSGPITLNEQELTVGPVCVWTLQDIVNTIIKHCSRSEEHTS